MTKARRLLFAAGCCGGGLSLAAAALVGIVLAEASVTRKRVLGHPLVQDPPDASGYWGSGSGEPMTLVLMGDSIAVGRGVEQIHEVPGVLLAVALSDLADCPVRLIQVAVTGSESSDLALQVERVLDDKPHVAVMMIGSNDVTSRVPARVAVEHLRKAVRDLRDIGCEVVVGTCPDLGSLRPVPQPLRAVSRYWSRQMAAAQTVAVVEADGRSVSLASILSPEFARQPEYFSADEFHPSPVGYARAAAVMLPSIADALGLAAPPDLHTLHAYEVHEAAALAADEAGIEVTAGVARRGTSFAVSLRRRPARLPTPAEVSRADHHDEDDA